MDDSFRWLAELFDDTFIMIADGEVKIDYLPEEEPVAVVSEPEQSYENQEDDLIFSGNNASKTGIIVWYEDQEWIKPKDKIFLDNILSAVKSSVERSALFNIARSNHRHIRDIITKMPDNHFFVFGLPESYTSGMNSGQIEIIGRSKVIICPLSLTDLVMNKEEKQQLWQKMRQVYGL